MIDRSQEYLRLAIAAAALLIGLSVAYHYVIYIPQRDRSKDAQVASKAADEARTAENERTASEKAALERRTNYRICVSNAQANYDSRWNASCKKRSDAAENNRADCIARGSEEAYCRSIYASFPATDCSLPGSLADSYDKDLQDEKKRCLDEAKTGVLEPL